jgi:hypothetical protein
MTSSTPIYVDQSVLLPADDNKDLDNVFKDDSVPVNTSNIQSKEDELAASALKREVKKMEKQRYKIRLCDPQGIYFYRHVPYGWLSRLLHVLSLLTSVALLSFLNVWGYILSAKVDIVGVGTVSDITITNVFECFLIILVLAIALKKLRLQRLNVSIKGYGIAMLANAFNRVILNYCKVVIYICAVLLVVIVFNKNDASFVFDTLANGILADAFNVILAGVNVFIFYRAFLYCYKDLSVCE